MSSSLTLTTLVASFWSIFIFFVFNQDKIRSLLKQETGKKDFDVFLELFSLIEHLKETSKIAKKALRPSRRSSGVMKNKKATVGPMSHSLQVSCMTYSYPTPRWYSNDSCTANLSF